MRRRGSGPRWLTSAPRRRGHFPTEQAGLKVLYRPRAATKPQHPPGRINGGKSILNTLAITYGDRLDLT